jgi:hypothetical protein
MEAPTLQVTSQLLALAAGLSRYSVLTLSCPVHGFVRANIEGFHDVCCFPCPLCGQDSPAGVLAAVGFTRRDRLPAHDILIPPATEIYLETFDEPVAPAKRLEKQICAECRRAFIPDHGNMAICGERCAERRIARRAAERYRRRVEGTILNCRVHE